jgi:hypothetical protein
MIMDENSTSLLRSIAQNYRLCLADFPSNLKPEHLDAPADDRIALWTGLSTLHKVISDIYEYFACLDTANDRWAKPEYCYQAIEGPVKLLWAMGSVGQSAWGPDGLELISSRTVLDQALKKCGCKDPARAFEVLEAVGFHLAYRGSDGDTSSKKYKQSTAVAVRYLPDNEPLLGALTYYAARLPEKKTGRKEKGVILEVFLRADFRPLLPGYTFHVPHLPAEESEVTRTLDLETLEVWNALTGFMRSHHSQYQLFFRVPGPRNRRWVADYSTKEGDYGSYSIFIDEKGLSVRIVLIEGTIRNMLEHIQELSAPFQENYLKAVACKDCIRCGKHVFYTHGDHVHRLCKSPWFISPHLQLEDLPDIERLIDFRLTPTT